MSAYLDVLDVHWPARSRTVTARRAAIRRSASDAEAGDVLKRLMLLQRRRDLTAQIGSVRGADPLRALALMQKRRDLTARLDRLDGPPDLWDAEAGFVTHAAAFAARAQISRAEWSEAGVTAEMPDEAGVGL